MLLPLIGSDFTVVTPDHSFVDAYSNLNNFVLVPLSDKKHWLVLKLIKESEFWDSTCWRPLGTPFIICFGHGFG
jgi:hypothetical protein